MTPRFVDEVSENYFIFLGLGAVTLLVFGFCWTIGKMGAIEWFTRAFSSGFRQDPKSRGF